ncbi:MAG: hypothetical protein H7125_12490 [Proteobacteria bacterium]|nr:hypothetical protein [Burkholderiales bacterium]
MPSFASDRTLVDAPTGSVFVPVVVGTPVERIEDWRLLRGRGTFVDDLQPEGVLHAAILRSTVAHGRILSIDVGAARVAPKYC